MFGQSRPVRLSSLNSTVWQGKKGRKHRQNMTHPGSGMHIVEICKETKLILPLSTGRGKREKTNEKLIE